MAVNSAIRPIFNLSKRLPAIVTSYKRYSSSNIENVLKSPYEDVEIPKISLHDYLFTKIDDKKWCNLVAAECGFTGRKYTFDQVRTLSANLAKNLRKKLKLNEKDTVSIFLPNSPEYIISILGVLQGGLIVTTINPIYKKEEIAKQLLDSNAKAVITLDPLFNVAKEAVNLLNANIPVISITNNDLPAGAINFKELVLEKTDFELPLVDPESTAILPYSSGTTGLPKGVKLSHRNIVANLKQFSIPGLNMSQEATADRQDCTPVVLPQFHIYGMTVCTFHSMDMGAKTVLLPKFTPESYIKTLVTYKPDVLYLAPPLVLFLSTHDDVKSEHLASIRTILSGAAPLGADDEERLIKKANRDLNIRQGYGLTETSPVVATLSEVHTKIARGSIGFALPNTLFKIRDLGEGSKDSGELLVKGPQVMQGYHNKPKETEEILVDGWLRTGDIVKLREDGFLFITDRLKELIKVKGFQVPPAELEEVIRGYPNVAEVGVIGIPNEKYGEVPRAYVVPKQGSKIDPSKLVEFVSDKVASYKRLLGGVSVIDELPKNITGKILRKDLKKMYAEQQI